MEHPRDYVLMSVRKLAKRLKTDPATMVRIVRAMRFSSYRQFQHYLHELSIVMATSFETMQDAPAGVSTVQGLLRASLNQDRTNLEGLARTVESRPINSLVRRIYSAKQILVVGGDLAASLALFLEHHLMMLGLPVTSAIYPAAVVHKTRSLTKHDVVIAISFHRGLRMTVEGLRQAHDNGVYCVGITDSVVSPLQRFADDCFLTSVEAPSFGASYVARMAFLNMLLVACANHRRARTMRILKQVEDEQRYGFRWFEE
jgi:DNA-binding MurR/RpiR family transcriptional regulator